MSNIMPSLPNYSVVEHRLTKKAKRWLTPQGCYVESQRSLYIDTFVIHEDVVLSSKVDLIGAIREDGLIKWEI